MTQRIRALSTTSHHGSKKSIPHYNKRKVTKVNPDTNNDLWPEEEKALGKIKSGKTKMIVQDGEEFLKELDEAINA